MASQAALITRRAQAVSRLTSISGKLAERFGVDAPTFKTTNRDPELARIQETEQMADFLEALAQTEPESPAVDLFREALDGELHSDKVELLYEAGFDSEQKLNDATDEDLTKIQGIGQGTVDKLRAFLSTR